MLHTVRPLRKLLCRQADSRARGAARRARGAAQPARAFTASAPDLPSECDVVVIGGGSIGASVLYHLQQQGQSAVLLEKSELTSGTTWHSAGMLWRLRPSHVDVELHT